MNFFKLHEKMMAILNEEDYPENPTEAPSHSYGQMASMANQQQSRYGNVNITGQSWTKLNMLIDTLKAEQAASWNYRKKGAILELIIDALGFQDENEALRVVQQMRQEIQRGSIGPNQGQDQSQGQDQGQM